MNIPDIIRHLKEVSGDADGQYLWVAPHDLQYRIVQSFLDSIRTPIKLYFDTGMSVPTGISAFWPHAKSLCHAGVTLHYGVEKVVADFQPFINDAGRFYPCKMISQVRELRGLDAGLGIFHSRDEMDTHTITL